MATLAEIVTRLERRVIDLPAAVSAESQQLVTDAHRKLQELHNFKTMEAVVSASTTAESASLSTAPPANFKEYRGQPWWTDDDGYTGFLSVAHSDEEVRRAFNQDTSLGQGRPRVLLHPAASSPGAEIEGYVWRVYPVPDGLAQTSDGEYPIQVPYWSYLSAPSTNDWFTDNAELFLLADATAEAFLLDWDEAKYLLWRQRAYGPLWDARGIMGGELLRAVKLNARLYTSGVETLVPYAGVRDGKVRL